MRLFALRGAISVNRNDAEDILAATSELMEAIMQRNALAPEAVVSCIFTATNDLNAEFPAVAARALGFDGVPLLCAREIAVPRAMHQQDASHTGAFVNDDSTGRKLFPFHSSKD